MTITADAIDALIDDDATATLMRALLIDADATNAELRSTIDFLFLAPTDADPEIAAMRETATTIRADREMLTYAALALSLCPMHLIDYAICFDDDNDECAAIRTIHPTHDS